jgi:hypothetical protein
MAGISFSVFREQILSGAKRQTIRAVRKNPIKEGETLYMWWKQRSPKREKLGETKCINIAPITIRKDGYSIQSEKFFNSGEFTDYLSLSLMAIANGFKDWQELVEFFEKAHGLPFTGVVIQWDSIVRNADPELVTALNDWSFRTDYRGNDDNGNLQVQVQIC